MRADMLFSFRGVLVLLLVAVLPACGFVDSGGSQAPPPASAGPDRTVQEASRVLLDASSLVDVGSIAAFQWRQSGGAPAIELQNATTAIASFAAPPVTQRAILEFTLTTVDEFGTDNSATVEITINDKPTAEAGASRRATVGGEVMLRGGASADTDGRIATFLWQITGTQETLTGPTPRFTLSPTAQSGDRFTIRLTVTDDDGGRATDTVTITADEPPVANAGANQSETEGQRVTLDGARSTDPDGEPLRFQWVQTDGGRPVTLAGATTATPSFVAPQVSTPRALTFELTVTDSLDAADTDSITVSIRPNAPPTANAGVNQSVTEGQPVTLNGRGSTDPEGNPLRFQWVQTDAGPPVTLAGATTASPSFTAPQVLIQRLLTFQLTVADSAGATAVDSITITVRQASNAPVAVNDAYSVAVGGTLVTGPVAGVLANDTDADSALLIAELVRDVANGSLTLGPGGAVTYVHDGTNTVSDTFAYRARDESGNLSNTATVSIIITAANEAPVAVADAASTPLDTPVDVPVIANDTDPDGTIVAGTVTITISPLSGSAVNNGFGAVTYSPSPGFAGTDSFQYVVQDDAGATSNAATVTITVGASTIAAASCWTTTGAQTLTASLGSGAQRATAAQTPQQYALITSGKKGTATLIDGTSGTFTYTPSKVNARGSDSFRYKTHSADGKTLTGEVTVIINPRVMPLGGAITAGVMQGAAQLPVPETRVGYRKPLQQKLNAAGYRMDFVGSQSLGAGVAGFDYQSEAHLLRSVRELARGSQAKDLNYPNTGVYAWLEQNPADFVLLHMGSENLRTASVDDVEMVLNEIDRWERDHGAQVRVLLARVIDRYPSDPRIAAFNNQVQSMAKDRMGNPINPAYPDRVRMVNQQAALKYPADLSDPMHPSASGYAKMADTWARAIKAECGPPPGATVK
ncbi:MAG: tandem-95 repeat protein [Gammaproteobacteria bacterium]|nr:tandem-95 repeat protein [Gammaproteobacteria bacterium]